MQSFFHVKLTFTEPLLGTESNNPDVFREFILSKSPAIDESEVDTLPGEEQVVKGTTVFHRMDDGRPCLMDYHIRGFFKDVCGALRRDTDSYSSSITAYKSIIDTLVFPQPRYLPIVLPAGKTISALERPLRAQTAQGERVALARSEMIAAGATLEFVVETRGQVKAKAQGKTRDTVVPWDGLLREWLDYARLRGFGQWRNGGWGRAYAEMQEVDLREACAFLGVPAL